MGRSPNRPKPFGGNDLADGQPLRADRLLFSAQGAVGGNRRRARQGGAAPYGRPARQAARPAAGSARFRAGCGNCRGRPAPNCQKRASQPISSTRLARAGDCGSAFSRLTRSRIAGTPAAGGQFVGQRGPEEMVGHQRLVDAAQAVEGQVPQASAHRIAHQQGAGQARPCPRPRRRPRRGSCASESSSEARIRRKRDVHPSFSTPSSSSNRRSIMSGQPRAVRDDDQHRLLLPLKFQQQFADAGGGRAVEVAGRLVGQEQQAGVWISARARATRCRSPPESSAGR